MEAFMKFFKFPLTLFLTILLFSNTGLYASIGLSWLKSFSVFAQNPVAASLVPVVKPTASVAPLFVGTVVASKAVKAISWSDWANKQADKCTISFNPFTTPVNLAYAYYKSAQDNPWKTSVMSLGGLVCSYGVFIVARSFWNDQVRSRMKIASCIISDMQEDSKTNHKNSVDKYVAKCRTLYFTLDKHLLKLIKDFYDQKNSFTKQPVELENKGKLVISHLWGIIPNIWGIL
jgi:hypothetical protein